ncbi:metal ABC transporter substrate-binding protein [Cellulomonas composti]|uniref:Zinc ABC transporter substrate-binding protein n=1 Tax=Cellulomonas composti TaxID=266130 RepID=A0A511J9Q0_9CELL|nr:metal ABC transporter substrate-binding protein [Cellulomonas composti]GEL94721.1 zinc ABC transporter substrate-binding protein [Cellulomonas composti]
MSPRRTAAVVALVLPAALGLGACSSDPSDGRLQVLASFYPLQLVAQEVGGDVVDVSSLTPPGAEPHDIELSPAQVSRVSTSDLVVYLSGFQAAVDDAVAQTDPEHVVDAADHVDLLTLAQEHAHDEHADEDLGGDDAHDEHDHGDLDPHFWLDPSRMPAVTGAVADALTAVSPEHGDEFRARADALSARFTELDARYESGLAVCERDVIVTAHAAFGYLADRYGLEQVGISGLDPEAEPSPARLTAVAKVVRDEQVTTIFFESLVSPKVAQTLADDLGIDAAVLDPIESISESALAAGEDYFTVADANLDALRVALSCS